MIYINIVHQFHIYNVCAVHGGGGGEGVFSAFGEGYRQCIGGYHDLWGDFRSAMAGGGGVSALNIISALGYKSIAVGHSHALIISPFTNHGTPNALMIPPHKS